ncbi:MAG: four helix bundle protein [Desulfobacterales bacterium]|nr:four helix bundle protein [Desulfobacterales bacterium]
MTKISNNKPLYDLEERTFQFAKAVRLFVKTLPKTIANSEDAKQVVRASGSVGANYREANESLSKKDFLMRIKISRKEAKESAYWLRLIYETNHEGTNKEAQHLMLEANELIRIFSAILSKSQ